MGARGELKSKEGRGNVPVAYDSSPCGRGNVLVAHDSYMRAAGTLPLPFDQDTNDYRLLYSGVASALAVLPPSWTVKVTAPFGYGVSVQIFSPTLISLSLSAASSLSLLIEAVF